MFALSWFIFVCLLSSSNMIIVALMVVRKVPEQKACVSFMHVNSPKYFLYTSRWSDWFNWVRLKVEQVYHNWLRSHIEQEVLWRLLDLSNMVRAEKAKPNVYHKITSRYVFIIQNLHMFFSSFACMITNIEARFFLPLGLFSHPFRYYPLLTPFEPLTICLFWKTT